MSPLVAALKTVVNATIDEVAEFEDRKYSAIGKTVLTKVVAPYCDKHGMSYQTCNGSFWFIDWDGTRYHDSDLATCRRPKKGRPEGPEGDADEWFIEPGQEEKDMIALLNMELRRVDCVGSYVPDYKPQEEA